MGIGKDFLELQEKIGYHFDDLKYLEVALTHTSYANEQRAKGLTYEANERLEFLGDAVLQIVISDMLYSRFDKYAEGSLTRMRQYLVCQKTLAKIAEKYSLGDYINVGSGEEKNFCRRRPRILANTLEAFVGAVYLDATKYEKNYVVAVLDMFEDEIKNAQIAEAGDSKTLLQILVEQSGSDDILEYVIKDTSGPEHDKRFTVVAKINNNEVGIGSAAALKDAEMLAAKEALRLFGYGEDL